MKLSWEELSRIHFIENDGAQQDGSSEPAEYHASRSEIEPLPGCGSKGQSPTSGAGTKYPWSKVKAGHFTSSGTGDHLQSI